MIAALIWLIAALYVLYELARTDMVIPPDAEMPMPWPSQPWQLPITIIHERT